MKQFYEYLKNDLPIKVVVSNAMGGCKYKKSFLKR